MPEWLLPALAQGETDVPFTDVPATFNPRNPNGNNRFLDLRTLDGFITPADQFFFIQHYNKPEIDAAAFRLKVTGLAKKPAELSLADLKAMKPADIVCGYECSGNSPRAMQGLSSNGRFTGVRLRDVLKRVGVDDRAREVVFFGADRGNEEVVFRQNTFKIQQQFARSITLENAMKPEPILAYALNGQPLVARSRLPAARGDARLVRRGQREVAGRDPPPGEPVPRQLPGALVPHAARRGRQRRGCRSADPVRGDRGDAAQPEVGDRARAQDRRPATCACWASC